MSTRLVTVPVVIHHLGLDGYGIWNIIMMTATYMRFGSVGIKTAFQKYVAEATGNGNYDRANRLLSTGTAVMFVFSVLALIPATLLSQQIAALAGVPAAFLRSAAGAIALLALIMFMANVGAAFESIVMGGHRIDLVRRFTTVLSIIEAVVIVVVLDLGAGLMAMAAVMGVSELIYLTCCYLASARVLPHVQLRIKYLDKGVLRELFRFAGSYQIVNLLEVVYASLLPFAILKAFGARSAGVYAVILRVVTSATILQDAFLSPLLSGGTMVYASGCIERMEALLVKAFKVTLALSFFPLGFISVFGPTMAYAWTGESDPAFRSAFWLVCATALFRSFSLLALVLYRVSGKALLDNIRQLLRIVLILVVVVLAGRLGFYGVLAGMATAELAGMVFMFFALTNTFQRFRMRSILPDIVRFSIAVIIILGAGVLAAHIPVPGEFSARVSATLKLLEICVACALIAWPTLSRTGAVTAAEGAALWGTFLKCSS